MTRCFLTRLLSISAAILIAPPLAYSGVLCGASLAIPLYRTRVIQAREAVLREDLHTIRGAIEAYTEDRGMAPRSLDELVAFGYLHEIPEEPFSHRREAWATGRTGAGIVEVHAAVNLVSAGGSPYDTW